jgi:hypothetical protein
MLIKQREGGHPQAEREQLKTDSCADRFFGPEARPEPRFSSGVWPGLPTVASVGVLVVAAAVFEAAVNDADESTWVGTVIVCR